jgi:hypothetical protein
MNMPIQKTNFYVNKYTDTDLQALLEAVQDEIQRRKEQRKRRREEWIEHMSWEAYHRAAIEVVGETVIVAVLKNGSIHMAKTHPIDGDVFDMDTGVAVAYCKAMGLRVPDFI